MTSTLYPCTPKTLLPKEFLNENQLKYYVWFTGTVGQAEWLITYSKCLRNHAWPVDFKAFADRLPQSIKALTLADHPDLIITKADARCTPLLSIEITEQRAFGTNSQQRMARLWAAALNNIPSAYVYPIESYQHDKIDSKDPARIKRIQKLLADIRIPASREKVLFLLFLTGLKQGWQENARIKIYDHLIKTRPTNLIDAFVNNFQTFPETILTSEKKRDIENYLNTHFHHHDPSAKRISLVPPEEIYHQAGNEIYYTYLRPVGEPESLLLKSLATLTATFKTPALPFKLPSDISFLFRSEGICHLFDDPANPHLSYRNLPPAPGTTPAVHCTDTNTKDDISLFFNYVDDCCQEKREHYNKYCRSPLLEEGPYWNIKTIKGSCKEISSLTETQNGLNFKSGDFYSRKLSNIISPEKLKQHLPQEMIDIIKDKPALFQVVTDNTPGRSMGDPYSGTLAVRDIVYTGKKNLPDFADKKTLLVFIVKKNKKHPFIIPEINKHLKKKKLALTADPIENLILLLKSVSLINITKSIRCHLLFSDLLYVIKDSAEELVPGIPLLLQSSKITLNDKWGEHLFI